MNTMNFLSDYAVLLCISLSLVLLLSLIFRKNHSELRPPGPPAWPVIGNIPDFGMIPHQNLHKLRANYGSVLWLKLGMFDALIVQSAKAAEELFKKNDRVFSDRMVPDSLTACDYDKGSIAIGRQGDYWRVIRKLCSSELLSPKRISESAQVRQNCIDIMNQWIKKDAGVSRGSGGSGEIELERYVMNCIFNHVGNFVLSRDVSDSISQNGNEFYENMGEFMAWSGTPNVADSFPFLKRFDPQGVRRNTEKHCEKMLTIISGFVEERIEQRMSGKDDEKRDFLDTLLDYSQKGETDDLPVPKISIIILEMFFAGTDTTSSTIQWGMSELLCNPESLEKLKDEIDRVIGRSRRVEESDISNLPYLQAVVRETLRLHPAIPLLLPRNALEDTEFQGYHIPMNTTVILNAWGIHRDPDAWKDPLSFKPERFIDSKIDFKGHHFELIPFGSGRRTCIGMLLAEKMVSITIARLVQSFEWKLPAKESPEPMDMQERMGIVIRRRIPLKVIPVERKLNM